MNNTARIVAGITMLISGSPLLLAPLDAEAQPQRAVIQACPGLTIDTTCLVPPTAATTPETTAASCVHYRCGHARQPPSVSMTSTLGTAMKPNRLSSSRRRSKGHLLPAASR